MEKIANLNKHRNAVYKPWQDAVTGCAKYYGMRNMFLTALQQFNNVYGADNPFPPECDALLQVAAHHLDPVITELKLDRMNCTANVVFRKGDADSYELFVLFHPTDHPESEEIIIGTCLDRRSHDEVLDSEDTQKSKSVNGVMLTVRDISALPLAYMGISRWIKDSNVLQNPVRRYEGFYKIGDRDYYHLGSSIQGSYTIDGQSHYPSTFVLLRNDFYKM